MSRFSHHISPARIERLAVHAKTHPEGLIAQLFARWQPSGQGSGIDGLRIGIRDGYLNLYRRGQSVAKIAFDRRGDPWISVHDKYEAGEHKPTQGVRSTHGQTYTPFRNETLGGDGGERVVRWIAAADSYAGEEKIFVDWLVAANPGIVDLEMGLPAFEKKGRLVAPRMDIVLVQDDGAVAFWEAKCIDNGELRAERFETPKDDLDDTYRAKIFNQLQTYREWFASGDRLAEVATAYRDTADTLVRLADAFGKTLDASIDTLAKTVPSVITRPGVVVSVEHENEAKRYATWLASFEALPLNHHGRLRGEGYQVHLVGAGREGAELPLLRGDVA